MKKVALVNSLYSSNIEKINSNFVIGSQIGLLSLNTLFNNNGIESEIIDLNIEKLKNKQQLSEDYYKATAEQIKDLNPDYIGFTAMSNNFVNALLLSIEVHQIIPNATIFFGGPQATAVSEDLLNEFPHINFVCIGESEVTVSHLIQFMKGDIEFPEIPSVIFRKTSTELVRTKQAELIPIGDLVNINYDSLIDKYQLINENALLCIEGGRGCPYRCIFCSTSTFWSRKFRIRPTEKLRNEIRELKQKCGIQKISIIHDLFTCDRKKLREFCEMINEENVEWACSSRVDVLNEEDILLMKESGCKEIFFGIESGSLYIQEKIGKGLDLDVADKIIACAIDNGINPTASFVIGFPFETPDDIEESLRKGLKYSVYGASRVLINILTPEHGSDIMNKYHKNLVFEDNYYINSNDSICIDLEKELELIRKYPKLFNHYYFTQNDQFNYHYLYFIRNMFNLLIADFKLTLAAITEQTDIKLIDLFFTIAGIEKTSFIDYDRLQVFKNIDTLIKNFMRYVIDLKSEDIGNIFKEEFIKLYNK